MTNSYFNYENDIVPGSLGRAEQVGEIFERVEVAFDKLPEANGTGTGFNGPLPVGTAVDLTHALTYGQFVSWGIDVSANGRSLINLRQPSASGDAAPKSYVDSQIASFLVAGADPSAIAITDLGFGTVQPNETVKRSPDGLSWVSSPLSEGEGISFIGLSALRPTRVNAAVNALETYDDDLELASAALGAYQNL